MRTPIAIITALCAAWACLILQARRLHRASNRRAGNLGKFLSISNAFEKRA